MHLLFLAGSTKRGPFSLLLVLRLYPDATTCTCSPFRAGLFQMLFVSWAPTEIAGEDEEPGTYLQAAVSSQSALPPAFGSLSVSEAPGMRCTARMPGVLPDLPHDPGWPPVCGCSFLVHFFLQSISSLADGAKPWYHKRKKLPSRSLQSEK